MTLILFDKLAVSTFLKYGFNILAVSEILTFKEVALLADRLIALIRLDNETVSVPIRSVTYCVFANKPVVGNDILLAPVVVMVISPVPLKVKFCPSVIVLPSLLTPVPPFDPGTMVLIAMAESATVALEEKRA